MLAHFSNVSYHGQFQGLDSKAGPDIIRYNNNHCDFPTMTCKTKFCKKSLNLNLLRRTLIVLEIKIKVTLGQPHLRLSCSHCYILFAERHIALCDNMKGLHEYCLLFE